MNSAGPLSMSIYRTNWLRIQKTRSIFRSSREVKSARGAESSPPARFPGQTGILQSRVPRNRIGPCYKLSIFSLISVLPFLPATSSCCCCCCCVRLTFLLCFLPSVCWLPAAHHYSPDIVVRLVLGWEGRMTQKYPRLIMQMLT